MLCAHAAFLWTRERRVALTENAKPQVALLGGMKATGRLLVLVQALTSPKLAAVDDAAGAVPAPLQVGKLHLAYIIKWPVFAPDARCVVCGGLKTGEGQGFR